MISQFIASNTFSETDIQSIQTWADENLIDDTSEETVISGLMSGTSETAARNNTDVLNTYFSGSDLNLIIPSNSGVAPVDAEGITLDGYWIVWDTVNVTTANMTITFRGGIMMSSEVPPYFGVGSILYTLDIENSGVTINNILVSQGGFHRTNTVGVYATVRVIGAYNTGNVTFNGGTIEGGGNNNFQQGRNNTVFNDVIFRNSKEHLVYATGIAGDGTNGDNTAPNNNNPAYYATGLHFNRCTFYLPGQDAINTTQESNHLQLRSYKDVSLTDCTINGISLTDSGYGILGTAITKLRVTNTAMFGFKSGAIWMGPDNEGIGGDSSDWVFENIETEANDGYAWLTRLVDLSYEITLNNSTFHGPMTVYGINNFSGCTFDIGQDRMLVATGSYATFTDTTWDCLDTISNRVIDTASGTRGTIAGTTTRLCPTDGHTMTWDIIPGSCP